MSIDDIAYDLEYSINTSTGVERQIYQNFLAYYNTGSEHFLQTADQYYQDLDFYERQRVEALYQRLNR